MAHYPHNENEIRLADRIGLLVWSEIPVYWDIDWTNPATLANAEAQLRDMIARDHNRAAVILWSMSNETPVKPERLTFLKQLAQDARELDSTRLITSAMNHVEETSPSCGRYRIRWERCSMFSGSTNISDGMGASGRCGQDGVEIDVEQAAHRQRVWRRRVAGVTATPTRRWTEEYQANLFQHQFKMVQRMPNLAGLTPWVLMDFRSADAMLPGIQDYHNRKGVISNRGQRKMASIRCRSSIGVAEAESSVGRD